MIDSSMSADQGGQGSTFAPARPDRSFRVTIQLTSAKPRMDQVVLEALRHQDQNLTLRNISRMGLKELFKQKKIRIKGQSAVPASSMARGTTYVDILGFVEDGPVTVSGE